MNKIVNNTEDRLKDILAKAFELKDVQEVVYLDGFFTGRAKKYIIPEANIKKVATEFPFIKNAIKSGLISKDKKTGEYFTTDKILSVKATDKKKSSKKQFFSINGDDQHERTTLFDGLVTVNNLRYISGKFGITPENIKFSLRYENGNPEKVVNYVEVDKKLFGTSDEEIESNIQKLNNVVQYERNTITSEATNA
jgi:hypothetical protein